MMNCPCRTAALRLFLRNITSTQIPAELTARQAARCQTLPSSLPRGFNSFEGRTGTALRRPLQSRSLHTTSARNSVDQSTNEDVGSGNGEHTEPSTAEGVKDIGNGGAESAQDASDLPARKLRKLRRMEEKKRLKMEAKAELQEGQRAPKEDAKPKKTHKERKDKERKERKTASKWDDIPKVKEPWQAQKAALKEKFPEGWVPRKKLSPDAMAGVRALHQQFPDTYTTEVLAKKFEVSPEAIRRILKSKWEANDQSPDIDIDRQERWFKRGKSVWTRWAELGKKPPQKWRREGIVRHPSWNVPRGPVHPQHLKKRQEWEERKAEREARRAAEELSGSLM